MFFNIKAIILGIIQGLTEFIPVSSSGHLVLAQEFLQLEDLGMTFNIVVHFATLIAVLIYFRQDIWRLLSSLYYFKDNSEGRVRDRKVILYLAIGSVVTGVPSLLFASSIAALFEQAFFVAFMLIVTGAILFISDLIPKRTREMHQTGIWRAMIIGISQFFAVIPGISRSGSTIATSLFVGLKRIEAAKFSFLLAIPAILGATIYDLRSFTEIQSQHLLGYVLGSLAAFITGYLAISILMKLIQTKKLKYFSFYVWALAVVVIIYILKG
ncbi:MAG: undecaprenyl-diphosphate phosphatase [Candidatus Cloacimonetes bacterium]|nr:undecaprenyl-diphosphate phosphatase [Candidatus Cloacimonadota bacterium]